MSINHLNRTMLALCASVSLVSSSVQAQFGPTSTGARDTLEAIVDGVFDGAKPLPDPTSIHAARAVVGEVWDPGMAKGRYFVGQDDATGTMPIASIGQSLALLRNNARPIVLPIVARGLYTIADGCDNKPRRTWFYLLRGLPDTTAERSVVAVAVPAHTPKALPHVSQPESGPVATWGPYKWRVKRLGGACD